MYWRVFNRVLGVIEWSRVQVTAGGSEGGEVSARVTSSDTRVYCRIEEV